MSLKILTVSKAVEKCSTALQMHQAGQLEEAAQLYQQILAEEKEHDDTLHLLGALRHQQGQHREAVELIGRAIVLRPNVAVYHANLAEAYRALGQMERAVGCCRTAVRLRPDYTEGQNNLGLALQGLGRHSEAVDHFRRAVKLRPDLAFAHNNLGISLRELKEFDQALTHFRKAAELAPDFAPALTNLGQMLVERGQAEEALPFCREAVRLQPDLAAMHVNLGNALRDLKHFSEAKAEYLEAMRLDTNLAQAPANLGLVLQNEGRLGDALTWLKQAVDLEPNKSSFWEHLADLYHEREESAEALPCWERVVALEPAEASAHLGLGWALQDEGRQAEAAQHYHTALRLQPELARAHLNLAGLHEENGDLAEAEAALRKALRLEPGFAMPYARLAVLLRGKLPDDDRVGLETRLADPDLGQGPRARLLFALAHVLDARGEYAGAAEQLREANALTLQLAKGKREYAPVEHERFVDQLLQAFGVDYCARTAAGGSSTRRPVFVFGLPRSGTTLIEQVLASHSRIHGTGELRLGRQSFEAIPSILGRSESPLDCIPHLDSPALHRLAAQHEEQLQALAGGQAERVVDKMPDNYLYLGFLTALFPNAVFIHCRRDLRDLAVSCWMTDFRSIRWANDPAHIASRFQQYRRLMDHWRTVLPVALHEVDYEETVADLEGVARRLVAACGLQWEPACLAYHSTRRPIRTASVTQVRQPIYSRSIARWKNYERELGGLFEALALMLANNAE